MISWAPSVETRPRKDVPAKVKSLALRNDPALSRWPPSTLAQQMAQLSQMVEDISGELALEPLLQRIVERACELIGADDGVIGLYDPPRDAIRTVASYNIPPGQLSAHLRRGQGLTGRVLELDAPIHCRYDELPHPTRAAALAMDMIGMPIRRRGKLIGVFGIGVRPNREFDADADALLAQFARHAGVAIENARRYTLEERRATRLALIVRVAAIIASDPDIDVVLDRAADAIHELLQFENVDIPLVDPADRGVLVVNARAGESRRCNLQDGRRLPITNGVMGAAARERRTQRVDDITLDPRYIPPPGQSPHGAELAVPILFGDEVLGVLNVEGTRAFDELDQQSLEVIAEHLALAIRSTRLFDRSRQLALLEERQRLARELHDNVTQILSSISMISQSLGDTWLKNPVEGARRATRLGELAQMAFGELRGLLKELSPTSDRHEEKAGRKCPMPDGTGLLRQDGLAVAVARVIDAMTPGHMSHCIDFHDYRPQVLAHEEALLRICQEAASNAIRHAGGSVLSVEAGVDEQHAWLRIADDGQGVCARTPPGMGVANMWQRTVMLGGSMRLAANQPRGTLIEVRLPRQDAPT